MMLDPCLVPHAVEARTAFAELPSVDACPREEIAIVRAFADWSA